MTQIILEFLGAAMVIVVAGTFLTRFADAIADRTGLGRLLVGSILLAAATSLPELTVDISAIRLGLPDLAVGDLMGSSLFNLLILACLDFLSPSRGVMLSRRSIDHALSGTVSALLAALVALALLSAPGLAPYAILGAGVGTWAVALAYLAGARLVYRNQQIYAQAAAVVQPDAATIAHMSLGKALAGFLAAAAVVFAAGPFLAESAGELAERTGLGATFIGTTLVALSTSLPELVTSLTAVRMGAFDLAIGNVLGSNACNMLLVVPLDFVYEGSLLAAVSPRHAITCIASAVAMQVVVMGLLYEATHRVKLLDPDAVLVIIIVVGSLALLYYLP